MSRSAMRHILALLALLLAGCSHPSLIGPSCSPFAVAPASLGSGADYSASGLFATPSLEIVFNSPDWFGWGPPPADPKMAPGGPLVLEEGSRLLLRVAGQPSASLSAGGAMVPAIQVSYHAAPPGQELGWVADERLGMDGVAVQASSTVVTHLDGKPDHQTRFARYGRPALLMATWFWGDVPPEAGRLEYPVEHAVPAPFLRASSGTMERTVAYEEVDGRCLLQAKVDVQPPPVNGVSLSAERYLLSFAPGNPFPVQFTRDSAASPDIEFTATQTHYRPGDGASLPLFRPASPPTGFAGDETELREERSPFPTSLAEAKEQVRMNLEAILWFNQHPDAEVVSVRHGMGNPAGPIKDEWQIEWADATGTLETLVRRQTELTGDRFIVLTNVETEGQQGHPARVTLDPIYAIHRELYGSEPEWVACSLAMALCRVGTMEAANEAYPGEPSRGRVFSPLMTDMLEGLILQDDSLDPAFLGEPVPP